MIRDVYREYADDELDQFAKAFPDRYEALCKIVGDFALNPNEVTLSIELPYECDKGCVTVSKTVYKNSDVRQAILLDAKYF